ncbi:hypothetical protein H112_02444 [Trichophyton rubrum D6]|nr:hypothetical protein H100_02445 [Trichophyton rubrum MR850]EZF44241.1 hypothetical protein H102_02441 [Trichophyton rubrum CBS 100081]EZF54873.1 hypothetical protein H103_02454 [Trichophyton rubrum CBS 288.86]EZF65522.1 hypothetical protein H104_02429 [Trichophyton rubrum CBS 289.86]EZF76150.1 hypothetical protein H105_02462 [Trichophyton soudanense CBS 452.61]EZF86810.1 hypothetical protein H110_02448 [Trichophyton rubrum MR1448]EZF97576.1 hypothetical protein H113_02458 [Trichophyton rub
MKSSFAVDSCVPMPACKSKTYNWDDLSSVAPNTKYLGDASKADWVSSGEPKSAGGNLLLTMAPSTVGTLLGHNHYMWYGKTTAKLKTSRGRGVVTAFILMSDAKDEIDFEFIGADLTTAQTNYYYQGITDYTHGKNQSLSNTFDEYHTYEIDWKPETITWSIDGKVIRTLDRDSTMNETTHQYNYPSTPARVQLSLWPAGLSTNGEGTIAWAGGLVDWKSEDIQKNGYYYALFDSVSIECYDPPKSAKVEGSKAYVYTDDSGTEGSVKITDDSTVLKSFLGNGKDKDKDYPSPTKGGSNPPKPTEVAVIPGLSGAGPGLDGKRPGDGEKGNNGGSGGNGGSNPSAPQQSGFTQGPVGGDGNSSGASAPGDQVLQGSLFAVFVAIMALVTL